MSETVDREESHPATLARVDEIRRFTVYGTTADAEAGEALAIGVQFPDGAVFATLDVPIGPVTFEDMAALREATSSLADGPGGDQWIEYEDGEAAP